MVGTGKIGLLPAERLSQYLSLVIRIADLRHPIVVNRGTAFIGFLMAIKELSPAICVLENVPQYSETISMHMIRETLKDWQYSTIKDNANICLSWFTG